MDTPCDDENSGQWTLITYLPCSHGDILTSSIANDMMLSETIIP